VLVVMVFVVVLGWWGGGRDSLVLRAWGVIEGLGHRAEGALC
jgi:hypothetical protein